MEMPRTKVRGIRAIPERIAKMGNIANKRKILDFLPLLGYS